MGAPVEVFAILDEAGLQLLQGFILGLQCLVQHFLFFDAFDKDSKDEVFDLVNLVLFDLLL